MIFSGLAWSRKKTRVVALPYLALDIAEVAHLYDLKDIALREQDHLGLQFMARAGYDITQVPGYRRSIIERCEREIISARHKVPQDNMVNGWPPKEMAKMIKEVLSPHIIRFFS